ncbi:TPA: hypothetical protein ACHOZM_000724 [Raoultella ornithinolytica]
MTKSTITRERVVALIAEHSYDSALVDALEHLLAAIDSEPVSQKEPISFDEWSRKCALQVTLCHSDFREKAQYIWDSARETMHVELGPLYRHAQPAPVVPDSYVMVPMRLTAENGAKGALSGEFSETKFVNCPECFGDDECETCDGSGRIEITVPVTWTTIKEIWAKGVEHFAAAPQEVK